MNRIIWLVFILIISMTGVNAQSDTLKFEPGGGGSDSVEYELIVLDPGYEMYLATQPSKEFYTQSYYEAWNSRYVSEWNYRHSNPLTFGNIYETYIDYSQNIDYGLELNYKLYHYFRFFEKENGVDLLPERGR